MPAHAVFIDVDAEAGAVERVDMAARGLDRLRGDVFGERDVGQRQRPGDVGEAACLTEFGGSCRSAGFTQA